MTSQQRQLLDAFRASPGRKLTTSQLASLPIVRYSARILELKGLGYAFTKRHVGKGQYEYKLTHDVERDSSGLRSPASSSPAAVSLSAVRPLNPYEFDLLGEAA